MSCRVRFRLLAVASLLSGFPASWAQDSEEGYGDARLSRWAQGMGGRATFRQVPSFLVEGRIETEGQPEPPLAFTLRADAEGRFVIIYKHPSFELVMEAYDGKVAWRNHDQWGSGLLLPEQLAERWYWDDVYLPLRYREMFPQRRNLQDQQLGGRWYNVFEMTPLDGVPEHWYQDYQTGFIHARLRPGTPESPPIAVLLEDYRSVHGRLTIPHRVTSIVNGRKTIMHRDTVKVAPALKAEWVTPSEGVRQQATEAAAILERCLEARGGTAAAEKLRSRVMTGTVQDRISGLTHSIKITQMHPLFILTEAETAGIGRTLKGFDGTTAWAYSDVEGYRELKGGELMALMGSASLTSEAKLREHFPFAKRLDAATEADGAVRLQLASWVGPAGTYWFDERTGHLVRIESVAAAGARGSVEVSMELEDFRNVDGVILPFSITTRNAAMDTVTTFLTVEHNLLIDPGIFVPRKDG